MTKRSKFDRIPADEVLDSKPWHLPYWVEPSHLVQQEEEDEVLVEEEEIEVEPLTAEQLEQIRQEAYNEGLEQGLVEGRQKGERLGYEQGHQEGVEAGRKEGFEQGEAQGKEQGEQTAIAQGKARTDQKVSELNALLQALYQPIEQERQELDALLPELVLKLTEEIIEAELGQGSEHAIRFVKQALHELPSGAKNIEIFLSPLDLPYVEAAVEQDTHWHEEWSIEADDSLQAGGCRIVSHESIVDFTREKRWQTLLNQFVENYKLGELSEDSEEKIAPADAPLNEPVEPTSTVESENEAPLDPQANTASSTSEANPAPEASIDPQQGEETTEALQDDASQIASEQHHASNPFNAPESQDDHEQDLENPQGPEVPE